jgi:hypothetical protein
MPRLGGGSREIRSRSRTVSPQKGRGAGPRDWASFGRLRHSTSPACLFGAGRRGQRERRPDWGRLSPLPFWAAAPQTTGLDVTLGCGLPSATLCPTSCQTGSSGHAPSRGSVTAVTQRAGPRARSPRPFGLSTPRRARATLRPGRGLDAARPPAVQACADRLQMIASGRHASRAGDQNRRCGDPIQVSRLEKGVSRVEAQGRGQFRRLPPAPIT